MKCYKYVFNISIINNYGFFIISSIMILYFICLIIFLKKSFNKLLEDIAMIISGLKNKIHNKNIYNKKIIIKTTKKSSNNILLINNKNLKQKNDKKIDNSKKSILETNINDNKTKYEQKILLYKDFEINLMNYKKALKLDKRSYTQYYISILKNNHLLIFSFFPNKDFNSRIIKAFLFFFYFAVHFTINALFFNDNTIHEIYQDKGNFNFIYQIPQIIYSSLISGIINILIKYLSSSRDSIVELKNSKEKNKNNLDIKHQELLKSLKIKFFLFFILSFIILLFCWYYITCFCGIYINTQLHLIKDSIISFATSLIYPFAIYLLPGIFRIKALHSKEHSLEYIYKLSLWLQMI